MTSIERPPNHYGLPELKEWLSVRLEEGITCPCCGQHAQTYKRRISKAMVSTMGHMLTAQTTPGYEAREKSDGRVWVHLSKIPQQSRDTATCAYFGLIQEATHHRGLWRVTEEGRLFLIGVGRVFKYAHVFNGRVLTLSGPQLSVYEVAPRFDLVELTKGS